MRAPDLRLGVALRPNPCLQSVERGALGPCGLLHCLLSLCVGRHRIPRIHVAHPLHLQFLVRLFLFRHARQADVQERARPALPATYGEVPVGQRVGVSPVEGVMNGKLREPCAGVLQCPFQPVGGDYLVVPGSAARVHRGDCSVAKVSEGAERVEGGLRHGRRVAPLRPQRPPPLESLRSPRLDLDDHRIAVGGWLRLLFEEEELRRGPLFFRERHPHRAVGVSGDDHVGTDTNRNSLRVLGVGGIDQPPGPLHRVCHHRLKRVAHFHRRQRLLAGGIGRLVVCRGVPEGAAAVAHRRGAHLYVSLCVEPRRRAGKYIRPRIRCGAGSVDSRSRHVACSSVL